MIEFLPPRDGAFGESDSADFVGFDGDDAAAFGDEPPQSRWLTAFAVLGVTGLLAGGVIAAAPWDDEVATPPPTTSTTVPTTTTIPRPTSTTEPGLPPGVSADIPGMMLDDPTALQYVLVDAQSIDDGYVTDTATALWSTPGATRTSGAWVAIVSREQMGDFQELRRGGMRATMGDRRVLVDISVDQVVEVVVPPGSSGGAFSVNAFGISLDDLTRIVSGTSVGSDIDVGDLADPGGPLDGLEQVVDLDARSDRAGWLAYSYFIDPTGQRSMQATLTNADPQSELIETLVWTRPIDPTLIDASIETSVAELRADHPDVELLQSANADGYLAVRWRLPSGDRVTVWGDAPVGDLIKLASHLELAEPDEWREAVIASLNGFESAGDFAIDPPVEIDDAERQWTASVGDGRFTISGEGFWYSSRFEAPTGPHLEAYMGNSVAFVRATNTWPNDGLQIVVTQPGLEPTTATLVQVNDTLDFVAVVEIDGDLPYEVQWLDLDDVSIDGPTTAVP